MHKRIQGLVLVLQTMFFCSFAVPLIDAQSVPQFSTPGVGQHDPNRPVIFSITFGEEVSAGEYSHKLKGEARYALLPSWDGFRVIMTPEMVLHPDRKDAFTSERAFDKAGGFLGLKPKQIVQFYVKEYQGSGRAASPNGPCTWSEKRADGVAQITGTFGKESFRYTERDEGVLDNADADFVRTETGGELHFYWREPRDHSACSDVYSERASNYSWTRSEVAGVRTFVFTNEQLKYWKSLRTTISGTNSALSEALGGPVRLSAAYSGAVTQKERESKVQLAGCFELGLHQETDITASAEPDDGTFTFTATPASMVTLKGDEGARAMRCDETGRGVLKVTFDPGDGKTTETSHEISCVELNSVNGGEEIPKIGFFDENGRRIPPKAYPVSVAPEGGGALLVYRPTDPALVTAVNRGDSVLLQPVRVGKTSVQAATECGGPLGRSFAVDLVYCDEEVIERLTKEEEHLSEEMKEEIKKIETIARSEKYNHALNHIPTSIAKLTLTLETLALISKPNPLREAGEIVSVLTKAIEGGVGAASFGTSSPTEDAKLVSTILKLMVEGGEKHLPKTISESITAAEETAELVEELHEVDKAIAEMEEERRKLEKTEQAFDDVRRREQLCEKGPSGAEPPPPEPDPVKPGKPSVPPPQPAPPSSPRPGTSANPPAEPPQTPQEPPPDHPPEPPQPPPPPTSETWHVALPYDPTDCKCKDRTLTAASSGFKDLQEGYANLGTCLQHGSQTLKDLAGSLQEWTTAIDSLVTASQQGTAAFLESARAKTPQLRELSNRTQSLVQGATEFAKATDGCSDGVKEAGAMLEAAPARITRAEQK